MTPDEILADLERRAELGGGEERLKRHHDAGKLTARDLLERAWIEQQLDALARRQLAGIV